MSIEPQCSYCDSVTKYRCRSQTEADLCDNYEAINLTKKSVKNEGTREHLGKQYTRLVPIEAIAAAAASFEYGAQKYSLRNWEKGLSWQTMIDSLKRHIEDFELGKDYDDGKDGSHLPHVCMIMASACMLTASYMRKIGNDDRIKGTKEQLSSKTCLLWMYDELNKAEQIRNKNKK